MCSGTCTHAFVSCRHREKIDRNGMALLAVDGDKNKIVENQKQRESFRVIVDVVGSSLFWLFH